MKLSVLMITYNQADLVRQAIESALAQRTPFDFEIVVGHDPSTDRTAEVLDDLARSAPAGRLQVRHHAKRLGVTANFLDTYHACRGEYVALLEGDDYWIDPWKLAKQVAFLDSHSDYSQCFHPVRFLKQDGLYSDVVPAFPADKRRYTTCELIYPHYLSTCSIVARNYRLAELAEWTEGMPGVDWIWTVLHSLRGPVGFLPDVMGVYRRHGGVSTSLTNVQLHAQATTILARLREHLPAEHHAVVDSAIALVADSLTAILAQSVPAPTAEPAAGELADAVVESVVEPHPVPVETPGAVLESHSAPASERLPWALRMRALAARIPGARRAWRRLRALRAAA